MSSNYEKKLHNIMGWIDEYIEETFTDFKSFGHLLENHVNKTDEFLMNRCKGGKKAATSFLGKETDIIALVKDTLLEKSDEIAEYLADDEDNERWEIYGMLNDNVQGHSYSRNISHDWNNGPTECSEFIIAIEKLHAENGFVVVSVYPTNP